MGAWYNKKQKGYRDKRLVPEFSQRNDRAGAKGRSFPFEDLITQTHNAKDHKRVSEKLPICNHSGPPFPGDKAPIRMGD